MSAPQHVEEGTALPAGSVTVTRADLVRYAGAGGDLNPIHWHEPTAVEVGLPGVIAHGMLTMALAAQYLADWIDDPAAIVSFSTRFTKPVVVPDDETGATVELGGTVKTVHDDGTATIALTATAEGKGVLGKALARVRVASREG